MARRRPSSKPVWARKPKSRSARAVSRLRRGCPLGLVVSQRIAPVKPVRRAMCSTSALMVISRPAPKVDRLAAVVLLAREQDALGGVGRVEELARGAAVTPHLNERVAGAPGLDALLDQRGDDVRGRGVEVIARAIQVGRQQVDTVEAILVAVGLLLHQQRLLGKAVGRVGFLGVAVPKVVFAERHGRVLGVGADGADGDELVDAGDARGLDELHAHQQVVVEEFAGALAVGADAADDGGEVDDHIRPRRFQQPADGRGVAQVAGGAARYHDVAAPPCAQPFHNVRAEETGPTRHDDRLVVPVCHCPISRRPPLPPATAGAHTPLH